MALVGAMLAATVGAQVSSHLSLSRYGEGWVFGDRRLSVVIGPEGFFAEARRDGLTLLRADPADAPFELNDGNGPVHERYKAETRCVGVERLGESEIRSRILAGPWQIDFHFALYPEQGMIRRKVVLDRTVPEEGEYHGMRIDSGCWDCALRGGYIMPFRFPPVRREAKDFEDGWEENSWLAASPAIADNGAGMSILWAHDWMRPYGEETPCVATERADGRLRMEYKFSRSCGYVRQHEPQTLGDVWCWFRPGDRETMLRAMGEWYAVIGQRSPADRPQWIERASLYCMHPGGTIESGNRDWGGFKAAAGKLAGIRKLGCGAVWLRPVEDEIPYHPRDYYRLQEGIGTQRDYRRFVATAHDLGLRVLQDIVPHGGHNTNDRAKAHPEWIVRRRDGSELTYWCFDQLSPTWIDYMANVAEFYMRSYDIDGFRIDSANGSKTANWTRGVPYARASLSQEQGGQAMQRAIRAATRAVKPDAAILAEARASHNTVTSDAIYDMDMALNVFPIFATKQPADAVRTLRRWLHEQHFAQVPGTVWLRYVESHDTIRSAPFYGSRAQVALFAVSAFVPGIVMVNQEMEDGRFQDYREILRVRAALPEMRSATSAADFVGVDAPDGVFACLRSHGSDSSVALVNFNEVETSGDVTLPAEAATGVAHLTDASTGETLSLRGGRASVRMAPLSWRVLRLGSMSAGGQSANGIARFQRVTDTPDVRPAGKDAQTSLVREFSRSSSEVVLAVDSCEEWFADTAEGRLNGLFSVRHPDFNGTVGGMMYDESGGETLFDSRRTPFGFDGAHAAVGFVSGGHAWELRGLNGRRVRLLDRIGSDHGLKIAIKLQEGEDPKFFIRHFSFVIQSAAAKAAADGGTGDPRLRQIAGGWVFEEGRLRIRFARNGAIVGVWRKDGGEWTEVVRDAQIVSPCGWNWKHAPNGYEQRLDLEPDISFARTDDGTIECRFAGRLRGAGRTGKMQKPVRYKTTLRFKGDEGFDIAASCSAEADSVDPDASLSFRAAFVAPGIDLPTVEWAENDSVRAGDKPGFSIHVNIPHK